MCEDAHKMAEANISVAENHFQCPICLELLKDPVTIPCGHSYCAECIKNCWDQHEVYSCPQCRQTFNPRPVLGRNPILADMVTKLKAQGLHSAHSEDAFAAPGDVECTVCIGRKRKAERSCMDCLDSYCALHLCRHEELHSGKKHKMVEAAAQLQKKLCLEHSKPLEAFCQTDRKCLCVECITGSHKGHDVVSLASAKEENQCKLKLSIQTEILQRETELNNLTANSDSLKSSAQALVEACDNSFAQVLAVIEKKRSEVAEMIRAQEEAELSRAEQLQEEISVLKKRAAEMPQFASQEDDIHFLQNLALFSPDDLPRFASNANYSFKGFNPEFYLKDFTTEMEKTCNTYVGSIWRHVKFIFLDCYNMSQKQLKRYSCNPKFDCRTAFRHHLVSEDDTKVEWSHEVVCRGRNWDRFTDCRQVLCKDELGDRAYWEVEWSSERDHEVSAAVAYVDIDRDEWGNNTRFGRNEKSWCLERSSSGLSFFHNNVETKIPGRVPSKIGVYLRHKEGSLSFYSINEPDAYGDVELIFSVQAKFTDPLLPGFYVTSFCSVKIY